MDKIRVFKDTKLRANEFAQYTDAEGNRHPQVPRNLLEWADVAEQPADYSVETYDMQEVMEAPYVIFTKKSDEQLAQLQQSKTNAASLAYLAETDWMVTRFAETGTPIPEDIKAARQAARDAIVKPEPVQP